MVLQFNPRLQIHFSLDINMNGISVLIILLEYQVHNFVHLVNVKCYHFFLCCWPGINSCAKKIKASNIRQKIDVEKPDNSNHSLFEFTFLLWGLLDLLFSATCLISPIVRVIKFTFEYLFPDYLQNFQERGQTLMLCLTLLYSTIYYFSNCNG